MPVNELIKKNEDLKNDFESYKEVENRLKNEKKEEPVEEKKENLEERKKRLLEQREKLRKMKE